MKVWSWRSAILKAPLESNTKLVLMVLSVYMNEQGDGCYPTVDMLVKDSALARATVIKHIDLAEEAGFIRRKRHGYKGRNWSNNEYIASYPKGCEIGSPQDIACGSSTTEPPCETLQGSSTIEPAQARGSSMDSTRQFNGRDEAVQPLNSNTPINTPIPLHPRKRAGDDDLIKIFDEVLVRVFGEGFANRKLRTADQAIAKSMLDAGATPDFFRAVATEKMQLLKDAELDAPTGLVYFCDIITEELDRAVFVDGVPFYKDQPRPEAKQVAITVESIGGDTPENRFWLSVLERLRTRHGDPTFQSWMAGLRLKEKNCTAVTVTAPSNFICNWVKRHYAADIKRYAQQVIPEISTINFEVSK